MIISNTFCLMQNKLCRKRDFFYRNGVEGLEKVSWTRKKLYNDFTDTSEWKLENYIERVFEIISGCLNGVEEKLRSIWEILCWTGFGNENWLYLLSGNRRISELWTLIVWWMISIWQIRLLYIGVGIYEIWNIYLHCCDTMIGQQQNEQIK